MSRIFAAAPGQRAAEVRGLFAEVPEFNTSPGYASLAGATGNAARTDIAVGYIFMSG